jgi:hypothetical protein
LRYPFADWADGDIWRLQRGEDFTSPTGLRSAASVWAKAHGFTQHVLVVDADTLEIQFVRREE